MTVDVKAFHEVSKLFQSFTKWNARYSKLESNVKDRKLVEYEQLKIVAEVKYRIAKFMQKYKRSPVLNVDPETRTIVLGFRGEHREATQEINIGSSSLLKHVQEVVSGFPQGITLETSMKETEFYRETKAHEELLPPKKASEMLGINYRTLWRWAKEGKIDNHPLPSGHLRYPMKAIEKILKISEGRKVELLMSKEASKMLGVTPKTLRRWVKEGRIHQDGYVQLPSSRFRYCREEIERLKRVQPRSEGA